LGRGDGVDDGGDAAEGAVDVVGFAADGAGGHAGRDDGGFDAAEVEVGEGPVAGEVEVGEAGVVGGEARGGGAGEAEDVEFGGVDVDAEELGVEGGLPGIVDALYENGVVEVARVGWVGSGGEDGKDGAVEELAGVVLDALALGGGIGGVVEGLERVFGDYVAEVGDLFGVCGCGPSFAGDQGGLGQPASAIDLFIQS
jgi:hypothetical protein